MSHTVLLINPNTSRPTTDMMVALAQACFQSLQRNDIQVRGLTAPEGPGMLTEMKELEQAFEAAFELEAPVLVHVKTIKGRGYAPAEEDAMSFHGASLPPIDLCLIDPTEEPLPADSSVEDWQRLAEASPVPLAAGSFCLPEDLPAR